MCLASGNYHTLKAMESVLLMRACLNRLWRVRLQKTIWGLEKKGDRLKEGKTASKKERKKRERKKKKERNALLRVAGICLTRLPRNQEIVTKTWKLSNHFFILLVTLNCAMWSWRGLPPPFLWGPETPPHAFCEHTCGEVEVEVRHSSGLYGA